MTPWGSYALVLIAAFGATTISMPVVIWLANRTGAIAQPDERRVHDRPTPSIGGVGMMVGLGTGLFVASLLGGFSEVFSIASNVWGVVGAAVIIFITGLIDDYRDVSAPAKVAGTVLSGSVLSLAGITIVNVPVPFIGFTVLAPDLAVVLSVLWVIVMSNATNLIDGLDGLAAGTMAIAAGAFLVYGIKLQRVGALEPGNVGPLLAVIVVGVCLGFLPWNFSPAKIFMGDSGALLLGLLMAASTIAVGGQSDDSFTGQSWFFFAPLVLPLVILGVPLFDMMFAVLRRATRRQGLATADKDHLHHRLMRLGHGQRRAVVIMWGFTAVLSGFALVPVITRRGTGIVPIALAGVALLVFTALGPGRIARRGATDAIEEPLVEPLVRVDP